MLLWQSDHYRSRVNTVGVWFRVITWMYNDASPTHTLMITHYMVNDESRWVIILHKLDVFMITIEVEVKFTSFPCFQLSLHLKSIQTPKHCSFVTKRLWCNIILQAPWMERVVLTAFICKSLWGSVLLFVQELKTSVLHSLVCGGKHQICTNGKKKKHYWQHPRLIYALIRSKQRLRFSLSQMLRHNMWKITHTDTQHAQSIRKLSMHRINIHCVLIKLGTSTGECVCQMYEKIISLWVTGF